MAADCSFCRSIVGSAATAAHRAFERPRIVGPGVVASPQDARVGCPVIGTCEVREAGEGGALFADDPVPGGRRRQREFRDECGDQLCFGKRFPAAVAAEYAGE